MSRTAALTLLSLVPCALAAGLGLPLPAQAEPQRLSDPATGAEEPVVGVLADGRFVSAWREPRGRIVARRHAPDGTPLGPVLIVKPADGNSTSDLRLAVNDDGVFVVSWQQYRSSRQRFGVEWRRYDAADQPGDPVLAHSFDNAFATGSDVAIDDDGDVTVVWREAGSFGVPLLLTPYSTLEIGNSRVQARRFDASGQPIGNVARIAASLTDPTLLGGVTEDLPPAVATDGAGHALVVWSTRDGSGPSTVFGRRLGTDGQPSGPAFRVDPRDGKGAYGADVAMSADGTAVVAWQRPHATGPSGSSGYDVLARRYDTRGRGGPVIEVGERVAIGSRASISLNANGEAVIAWPATSSDFCCFPPLLAAQRLDREGRKVGGNLELSAQYSEAADAGIAADGRAVVVWSSYLSTQPAVFASLLPAP